MRTYIIISTPYPQRRYKPKDQHHNTTPPLSQPQSTLLPELVGPLGEVLQLLDGHRRLGPLRRLLKVLFCCPGVGVGVGGASARVGLPVLLAVATAVFYTAHSPQRITDLEADVGDEELVGLDLVQPRADGAARLCVCVAFERVGGVG